MTYTGHCPHCKQVVRAGHGGPVKRIGSPIMTCPHCNKKYLDENMYEWAVIADECKLRYYFIDNGRWFYVPFLALLAGGGSESFLFGCLVLIVGLAAYWLIVKYANDTAIQESFKRCSNISYVDTLVEVQYEMLDQRFTDDYHARHKKVISPPARSSVPHQSHSSVPSDSKDRSVNISPLSFEQKASLVCKRLWSASIDFIEYTSFPQNTYCATFFWSAYLYSVHDILAKNNLLDLVEKEFISSVSTLFDIPLEEVELLAFLKKFQRTSISVFQSSSLDCHSTEGISELLSHANAIMHNDNTAEAYIPTPADITEFMLGVLDVTEYAVKLLSTDSHPPQPVPSPQAEQFAAKPIKVPSFAPHVAPANDSSVWAPAAPDRKRNFVFILFISLFLAATLLISLYAFITALPDSQSGKLTQQSTASTTHPVESVERLATPANGKIIFNPIKEGVAPLSVETTVYDNCYLILTEHNSTKIIMSFFVRANSTAEVLVPLGNYDIYYAVGESWYGTTHLFGDSTYRAKFDESFLFEKDSYGYSGWTIQMQPVTYGNLDSNPVDPEHFPD